MSPKVSRPAAALRLALAWAACLVAGDSAAQPAGGERCAGARAQDAQIQGAQAFVYRDAGRPLKIHVLRPAQGGEAAPAALFFFGGAWRQGQVSQFADQARALQAKGYVVGLVDYRVLCRDGTTPFEAVTDAAKAYEWLLAHSRELGVDRRRIVLAGGSAGGHLALMTALGARADARPAALVLFNPAVDLTSPLIRQATGLDETDARAISPALLDLRPLPRMAILHGENDQLVPIAAVRAFCARAVAAGADCLLTAHAGQGHGFFNLRTAKEGVSPFEATLARTLEFLGDEGSAGGAAPKP